MTHTRHLLLASLLIGGLTPIGCTVSELPPEPRLGAIGATQEEGGGPGGEQPLCVADTECGQGFICNAAGRCEVGDRRQQPCVSVDQCPVGVACVGGFCVAGATQPGTEGPADQADAQPPPEAADVCANGNGSYDCDGDKVLVCHNGKQFVDDCPARGLVCGFDPSGTPMCMNSNGGGAGGGAQPAPGGQGGACPASGISSFCDGNRAVYCVEGIPLVDDCASAGGSCLDTGFGVVLCDGSGAGGGGGGAAAPGGAGCPDSTEDGRCEGNTLIYCEGQTQRVDCAQFGLTCQNDGTGFFDCM